MSRVTFALSTCSGVGSHTKSLMTFEATNRPESSEKRAPAQRFLEETRGYREQGGGPNWAAPLIRLVRYFYLTVTLPCMKGWI